MYDEALLRKRIRDEREMRGMTQGQLAEQLVKRGLHAQWGTIAKIEAGSRGLAAAEAVALADVFGMTTDALVGRMPQPGGDLGYIRQGLDNTAANCERLLAEMADAIEHTIDRAQAADPEGVLSDRIKATKGMYRAISKASAVARAVREEQDR